MQDPHKLKLKEFFLITSALFFFLFQVSAQIGTTEFGKNRLQFKKMKWKAYNPWFLIVCKPQWFFQIMFPLLQKLD